MRPKRLTDYFGQEHLVGTNGALTAAIRSGYIPSIILWGPPGVGKTTLAQIIAEETKRPFFTLSAINSGVKDIREVIDKAREQNLFSRGLNPILFIDEIHRFSKSQQDSLLGAVEKGTITLIGATTENPSFEVIPALLSRSQVYVLKPHSDEELIALLNKASKEDPILKLKDIELAETESFLQMSGGDARRLLNNFELLVNSSPNKKVVINNAVVKEQLKLNPTLYDKNGEQHYDIISAFIKSIRGSDPNAAVYYLARMIEGGENPEFIARRLLILSSEDIGNANPNAMMMAQSCFHAVSVIGHPECRIILSQCAIYLASSPKSNASYEAINKAQELVRETGNLPVPLHIRNAPTKLMKDMGYGKNYQYSHSYENNFSNQEFLPEEIKGTNLVQMGNNKREQELKAALEKLWNNKYRF
ncbi:MAG: replication-associated recombination protein A [Flavobacteriales bacterium]